MWGSTPVWAKHGVGGLPCAAVGAAASSQLEGPPRWSSLFGSRRRHGTGVPVHVHTGGLIGAKKAGGGKFQFSVTCPLGCRLKWGSEATACSATRLVQYGALILLGRFDPLYETLLHILPLPAHPRFQDCLRFVKSHLLRWLKPSRDE